MVIIEDTRQQASKHEAKHEYFTSQGIGMVRTKLPFGDYALWGGKVSVDTKANVEEIADNIGGKAHNRFREECKLAQALGGQLVILVENRNGFTCIDDVVGWINPNIRKTARSIDGPRLAKAMHTMSERYGVRFEFCTPEESGRRVIELLENVDDK